ncbi:MAG: hypothetical protein WBY44_09660 [Bryobacteraceae bacterium]
MTPTQKERGVGKTRKNHATSDPAQVARKISRKPELSDRIIDRIADIDLLTKNTWSVKEAALWAGVPERTLYRLLRKGIVPCILMGERQTQDWPSAHDGKRRRACYRFLIPRQAFMTAWETLGIDKTAA